MNYPEIFEQAVRQRCTRSVATGVENGHAVYVDTTEDNDQCVCQGFRFHHHCKHIDAMRKHLCDWNSFFSEEPQVEEGKCPRCGADTDYERVAV